MGTAPKIQSETFEGVFRRTKIQQKIRSQVSLAVLVCRSAENMPTLGVWVTIKQSTKKRPNLLLPKG
jgi:hypothetical protein